MPGLFTGFLKGFNDATTAARTEASRQQDLQMERDQNILTTLAQHSEDPEIQANAIHGLVSITRGDYQPKSGFAKFFGKPGTASPEILSLLGALKGTGGGGGGSAPGAAPEGATATQPTTTLGESPAGAGAVESGAAGGATPPPAPSAGGEDEQLPTMGLAALPGGSTSALTGTQPGNRSSVAPVAGGGTAPIKPVQGATTPLSAPPIAPSPGGNARVSPPPSLSSVPGVSSPTAPSLAPGQVFYTPNQQADITAARNARQQSLQKGYDYQFGYTATRDSLTRANPNADPADIEAQAHMAGLRAAGIAPIQGKFEKVPAYDPATGQYYTSLQSYDPLTREITEVGRIAAPNPFNTKPVTDEAAIAAEMFGRQGEAPAQTLVRLTPTERGALAQRVMERKAQLSGYEAYQRGLVEPYNQTNPDLSTSRVNPPGPPPISSGKFGPAGASGITATPTGGGGVTPPPPITAPGGGGAPKAAASAPPTAPPTATAPKVGTQVGSNPGHPEAPVLNPPATPEAAAAAAGGIPPQVPTGGEAPVGSRVVQTKPAMNVDVESSAGVGAGTGARYLDTSQFSGAQKEMAVHDAMAKGIRPLSASQVASLGEFQKARQSILTYTKQILPYLASTPVGRIKTTFNNWLNEVAQNNSTLAALPSEWTTAIDTLRGPQMRITFPEIAKSLTGMPEPSDTIDTAVQKLQNITGMFDRAENAVLPPPADVLNAVRTGQLPPDHAWTIQSGPGAGQEWAYKGSTGALYRIK